MAKLTSGISVIDGLTIMGEGNPGAMVILIGLLRGGHPEDILTLDHLGIYGQDIWILFKDECGEDMETFHRELERRLADLS